MSRVRQTCFFFMLVVVTVATGTAAGAPAESFLVKIQVDASSAGAEWRPVSGFFGYDEPNYTYMKDGLKLLTELSQLGSSPVYIRCHNLLTRGDGTAAPKWGSTNVYREDAQGSAVYDWTILDRVFDTYHDRGLRPYVEIGFMPEALSTHPERYPHAIPPNAKRGPFGGGWNDPPRDYRKWAELVFQWVRHCVERYGKAEVETWYWELWNEPNLGMYWKGTPQEYNTLYDYTADAVKRALPAARVGGPEVADNGIEFFKQFLDHCASGTNAATGKRGTPLDFVSFHAKGHPELAQGHVRMGIRAQLSAIDRFFATVASSPQLKDKPIVIGESDPEGCAACPASEFPQNAYRNGPLYACYTAEALARTLELADKHRVRLEGSLTWAFEFEEKPIFAGYRVLATSGIDLPVLNAFRMLAKMGGRRVAVTSSADAGAEAALRNGVRGAPDVSALATLADDRLAILLWHYHDDDLPGPPATVSLSITALPPAAARLRLTHTRVDKEHSNAFLIWQRMGSPQSPSPQQYTELEKGGSLQPLDPPRTIEAVGRGTTVFFALPRQAVSLLLFDWTEK